MNVYAHGITYEDFPGEVSTAVTDSNGNYCLDVMKGSHVRLAAAYPGMTVELEVEADIAVSDAYAAQCANPGPGCQQLGDQVVDVAGIEIKCVAGTVVDAETGVGLADAPVFTDQGGSGKTDADGAFCVPVLGQDDGFGGTLPVRVYVAGGFQYFGEDADPENSEVTVYPDVTTDEDPGALGVCPDSCAVRLYGDIVYQIELQWDGEWGDWSEYYGEGGEGEFPIPE